MKKRSKRYREVAKLINGKEFSLEDALALLKKTASAKFDETVEVSVRLGVDPRHADQVVRGTVSLPHGLGKEVRVLVVAKGEKETEAKEAGADYAGLYSGHARRHAAGSGAAQPEADQRHLWPALRPQ